MSYEDHLLCQRHGNVAVLALNRPDRYNALTHALVTDLRLALAALDADPEVRAIVLTGSGRAFCSGADLGKADKTARAVLDEFYNPLVRQMTAMDTPIVAAVNGVTAGAGLSLVLATDLRICADTANFTCAFVKVGLVPDAGATWHLPRAIGQARASEMALLGRKVDAATAADWGLVNQTVPDDVLMETALGLADEVAALPASVGAIRRLLTGSFGHDLEQQLSAEVVAQDTAYHHPHYAEAKAAFLEKRTPTFY